MIAVLIGVPLIGFAAGLRGFIAAPLAFIAVAFFWDAADRCLPRQIRAEIAGQHAETFLEPQRLHLQLAFDNEYQSSECSPSRSYRAPAYPVGNMHLL